MKKKIMPKILVMAIVLFAMAPLFLTACGAPANLNAVAKTAAKDYYKNHADYENFANTTYVYEMITEAKYTEELEYLPNAEATETTKENFTNTISQSTVYKFYVVNVEEGELAVVIDINAESTEKGFTVDGDDLLKEVNEVNSRHTVYKLSYVTDGDDTTYYLTKEYEVKEGEQVVETAKNYREYDKDDYIYEVEQILSHINRRMINSGYFEMSSGEIAMFYGNMLSVKGSGSNVKAKFVYDTFDIDGADIIEMTMEFEVGFKNNKLGEVKNFLKMASGNNVSNTSAKFHVEFSAENVNTAISLTGATENEYLYVRSDDLPRVEFGFAS